MKKINLLLVLMFLANTPALADKVDESKRSCDSGNGVSCSALGVIYKYGIGVKQDYFKAAKYYQKACGLNNDRGCVNLGVMYEYGTGVKQSNTKALEYYSKACDLKNQLGCENYAKNKR